MGHGGDGVHDEMLRDHQGIKIYPPGTLYLCIIFHISPTSSSWDISLTCKL